MIETETTEIARKVTYYLFGFIPICKKKTMEVRKFPKLEIPVPPKR